MLALHGLWTGSRLAVWAEDARLRSSADGAADPATAPPAGARRHPYACPAPTLAALLAAVGPAFEWLAARARHGRVVLLMPVGDDGPAPSPELGTLGAPAVRSAAGTIRERGPVAYEVPALLFGPDEAAQLLGELSAPGAFVLPTESPAGTPAELPCGASLRWLVRVHDLAWRLVGRGRVLPVLTEGDVPRARWVPVLDAPVHRAMRELAAACPPVCRAGRDPERPAGTTATELLADLVDHLVDREARAALEEEPSPLPVRADDPDGAPAAAAEVWLRALMSADDAVEDADPAGLAALRDALDAWHRSARPAGGPLRLCFRLREPLGPDPAGELGRPSEDDWSLEFLVQLVEEPSLMVSAADLWAGGPALRALDRTVHRPREVFLAELGRAARHFPQLRRSLSGADPRALALDRRGAHAFLREAAPGLAAAGFGVLLPGWWQRPPRLGLTLTARTPTADAARAVRRVDQDAVVAFRWQAALGGEPVSAEELSTLAAAKEPLVRVRGQWLEADPERIAAAAAFLAREGSGTMAGGAILRMATDPEATAGGLPVTGVVADGALGALLSGRGDRLGDPVRLPATFRGALRPYQERGVAWLAMMSGLGVGAVLADDMGLGKTVQVLALLTAERAGRADGADGADGADRPRDAADAGPPDAADPAPPPPEAPGPTLLLCPMSLVDNWRREAARFAPDLRVHVHHGPDRPRGEALARAAREADLVVTSYGVVPRDAAALGAVRWHRIVADEAQFLKNAATRQAAAVRALTARHRIALTGTPVENRLSELHAVLDFANPGLFGSAVAFRERYAVPIEGRGDLTVAQALRHRIRPFVLRRLKTDPAVLGDLPEKRETTVLCRLTAEQATLYKAVVDDMLARLADSRGGRRQGLVLTTLTRLKQVCNHPAHFLLDGSPLPGRSGKVARLEEILGGTLANGEKALVFTQYAEFGAMLRRHLPGRLGEDVLYLHGGTPRARRQEIVARFQEPGGPAVLLLSLRAGGTGLNLTAASHVVHVDRWWNPAVEDQATDRAFRIGQRKDVQVHKLVCEGTVEERIDAMIEGKRELARTTVGTEESWLSDLSAGALHELLALSPSAEVAGG